MMLPHVRTGLLTTACCLAAWGMAPAVADMPFDDAAFQADLQQLTRGPHRLPGREDGSVAASQHVERRLREIGIEEIYIQQFPVVRPTPRHCGLVVDGQTHPLYQVRPNMLQASVTPPDGLAGRTLYAAGGTIPEYAGQMPESRIVVLDMDCEQYWLDAFAMGARAVIFVGKPTDTLKALQHINVPANLPRFYVPAEAAEALELTRRPRTVTIRAASEWRRQRGRNVIGVIRGTGAKLDPERPPQALVLAAPLDSYGEVPERSPGARDAANCAALLQIAAGLQADKPQRDIILCFFDGQTQNHLGARAFYGATSRTIRNNIKAETLETRLEHLQSERVFRQRVVKIVEQENLFQSPDPGPLEQQIETLEARVENLPEGSDERAAAQEQLELRREELDDLSGLYDNAMRILKNEAGFIGGNYLDELRPLRVQLSEMKQRWDADKKHRWSGTETALNKVLRGDTAVDDRKARVRELRAQLQQIDPEALALRDQIDDLNEKDIGWNKVKRDIHKGRVTDNPEDAPKIIERIEVLKDHMRELQQRRLDELDHLIEETRQAIALRDAVGCEADPDRGVTGNTLVLHVSLNLGDARRRWTFIHGDDSGYLGDDETGRYSTIFKEMRKVYDESGDDASLMDERAISQTYEIRMFAPARFTDSGAVARIFGIFNVGAMTCLDRLPHQGLPFDTRDALDADVLADQARQVGSFLRRLADRDLPVASPIRPTATFGEPEWATYRTQGAAVTRMGAGAAMADRPVRNAVVAVAHRGARGPWADADVLTTPPGFEYPLVAMTNLDGIFEVGPCSGAHYRNTTLFAVMLDNTVESEFDRRRFERGRGLIAAATTAKTVLSDVKLDKLIANLFSAHTKTVVGYGYERGAIATLAMRGLSTSEFRDDRHLICEYGNVLTVYAPVNAKAVKFFNKAGLALLNNENTKQAYQGRGLSFGDPFHHPVTARIMAHDIRTLNSYRLAVLADARVTQESLEVLNARSKDLNEDAAALAEAMAEDRPDATLDKYVGDLSAAAAYGRRTYVPLVGVMKDLVTAVVLLLLLAMPFAYALERLLIGTPHIYRQIGWFALFFILTFGVLFLVNPAFRIAATPIIIFLAFVIILLSSLVIFIMTRKLQTEIKKIQGMATTVHSADVSRLSTLMAAVNMGISTMRRRPLRTMLTSATVVLLTFTILTFASFGSSWGNRRTYQAPMSGAPPRILVRHQLWSPIGRGIYDSLRGHFAGAATVVPRYWISPTAQEVQTAETAGRSLDMLVASADAESIAPVSAAIGLDTRDLERQEELADLLEGRTELLTADGIFLTEAVRKELGLGRRDIGKATVLLAGWEFTYAGIIKDKLAAHTLLEGSSVLPVDYQASAGDSLKSMTEDTAGQTLSEVPDIESAQFVTYNLDSCVVVPARIARGAIGKIRALTIYPDNIETIQKTAQDVASICELPTYVGDQGGVYRLIFTSLTKASGWRDLLIPVVLGGLIIFATMMGSVSDREREIYALSSLGLAPPHVASLFFAEASVYAVVGGMGGYLLGQGVAQLLGYLASTGGFVVPTMNYSSTNAIVTVMVVMATVMISTVFPAIKASRSANPGVQRTWRIPRPVDDLYDLVFPFTVSAYDITGVVSFLKEHFDNYSDTALGCFAATESHIFRTSDDLLGIRATVALAPFDLGVNQNFALRSQPSDIEGIDEVRILIYRLSGAKGDWQRSNRVFINDLRKQLLIWRSLPNDVMDRYRQRTLDAWNDLAVETVDTQSIRGNA